MAKAKPSKESSAKDVYVRMADFINRAATGGKSRWQIFNDFLTVAAIGISNPISPAHDDTWQDRENQYLQIFKSYKEPQFFFELFGELLMEFEKICPHFHDVLGELFTRLNLFDEWKAQLFTPQSLSDLMSAVTIDTEHAKELIRRRGYVKIHEPATGGGVTLLSAVSQLIRAGVNPTTQIFINANDIDILCVYMTYIQLSLAGVPAIVNHKNTLTLEELSPPWYTPAFFYGQWSERLDFERRLNLMFDFLRSTASEPNPSKSHFTKSTKPEPKYEQLTLF